MSIAAFRAHLLPSLAALPLALCAGCTTTLYDWGGYEGSVYALCTDFRDDELSEHVDDVREWIEKTGAKGRVPPGGHAHLGYLLYLAGDVESALRHFRAEKELFPESSVFVDGILARLGA